MQMQSTLKLVLWLLNLVVSEVTGHPDLVLAQWNSGNPTLPVEICSLFCLHLLFVQVSEVKGSTEIAFRNCCIAKTWNR